ncbi:hypothetical protein, partial [Oceanobacillus saliphilus]|uniref:hypothetical protein n=1 Tax=Oceanobacillus saliphilus TaxID=2925834 RepID=UPI00201DD028
NSLPILKFFFFVGDANSRVQYYEALQVAGLLGYTIEIVNFANAPLEICRRHEYAHCKSFVFEISDTYIAYTDMLFSLQDLVAPSIIYK